MPKQNLELKCPTDSKPIINWLKQYHWKGDRTIGPSSVNIDQKLQQKVLGLKK